MQKNTALKSGVLHITRKVCILHKKLVAIQAYMVYNYEQGVIDSDVRKLNEPNGRSVYNYVYISGKQNPQRMYHGTWW